MKPAIFFAGWVSLLVFMSQCREPFVPDFETGKNDHLVVEGFISVGQKAVTKILLSRVASIDHGSIRPVEVNAIVRIETEDGDSFLLKEEVPGTYRSDSLTLSEERPYRLFIQTSDGYEYASSFSPVTQTPPIDSITWRKSENGINIVVSSNGGDAHTRFYSWTYAETWEIHSAYRSFFKYTSTGLKRRLSSETLAMYLCWSHAVSKDLLFSSTENRIDNQINFDLIRFSPVSERIRVKYSVEVEQRSLSEEEYRFLQLLEKNTNDTGSLYDPLPSELPGNVFCLTDPSILAVGYVGTSSIKRKRIFIFPHQIEGLPSGRCEKETLIEDEFESFFGQQGFIPVDSLGINPALDPKERPIYSGAPGSCMDCRPRGTSERPDFW